MDPSHTHPVNKKPPRSLATHHPSDATAGSSICASYTFQQRTLSVKWMLAYPDHRANPMQRSLND
ncbi:hypothetical protein RvY_15093 [Ramazzottius varieornatus]|uniref:Uncharacterized protein n=1 Tax=Ramazzottius varieornatus TaxID=947166 RepID=A0A1D1VVC3_RAMVA|nr:hypothetical protein RvY_15093 [Ramazzottius varieornatus]